MPSHRKVTPVETPNETKVRGCFALQHNIDPLCNGKRVFSLVFFSLTVLNCILFNECSKRYNFKLCLE